MFRFLGRTVRWVAIGSLLLVGLVAVVGVTRVKTAWWSVRDHLRSNVDSLVDSRVALRHEIKKLEREYPKRLSELDAGLRQIDRDLVACEKDRRFRREVVTMAENDVEIIRERLATAEGGGAEGLVSVEFRAQVLDRDAAIARASKIAAKASEHRARLEDLDQESDTLTRERDRLRTELIDLEREYQAFQAEAAGLAREIESVKRKEKLVALLERKRQDREDLFRDRASALTVVKEKIERRRIELDHRLRAARAYPTDDEYEARARLRLATSGD